MAAKEKSGPTPLVDTGQMHEDINYEATEDKLFIILHEPQAQEDDADHKSDDGQDGGQGADIAQCVLECIRAPGADAAHEDSGRNVLYAGQDCRDQAEDSAYAFVIHVNNLLQK